MKPVFIRVDPKLWKMFKKKVKKEGKSIQFQLAEMIESYLLENEGK